MTDFDALATRYIAAWNEIDPATRRRAIEALWAPDARYVDPMTEAQGREAIEATIAAAQEQFPDFTFRLVGPVDGHHNQVRFSWELGPDGDESGAPAPIAGFDVAETDLHGQLAVVLGFIDRVPAA